MFAGKNAQVDRKARLWHDPDMDLEVARKTLSKRSAFSSKKRIAFFVVAGLALVAGFLLRSGQYFGQPEAEQDAPVAVAAPPTPAATPPAAEAPAVEATEAVPKTQPLAQEAPTAPDEQTEQTAEEVEPAGPAGEGVEQAEQAGEAVEQAEQSEPSDSGMIMVSRQPIAMLASPSASASTMYGFPAGRPFRVIGREGGFAQIQDLRSGASGWIDEAALAPPPPAPAATAPSQSRPVAVSRNPAGQSADPKPKAAKKSGQVTADTETGPEPVQTRRRPGLFGRDGPFGGIFGGN